MRYLITGGAGFLGINLCRYLLARGEHVRSLDIAPFDYPERNRVDAIRGDIRDESALAGAMRDVDVVVHAAAALPLASRAEILSTDVGGTERVVLQCVVARVKRLIFTSSTAVYGIPDHHPLLETDALHGVGPYGEAKIAAEALCIAARRQGLCVSILRPKSFVGPERLGIFEVLCSWAFEGRNFPVLGRGDNPYQLLDVEDLCEVIRLCATLPVTSVDDVFNIGAREFGTMRENFQAVLDRAGRGRRVVSLPVAPAKVALRVLRAVRLSPLYPWIYETAAEPSWVAIDKLQRQLGFEPRYSNRDALQRTYDWYVANRSRLHGAGVTHRTPWHKGALGIVKWLF